MTVTSSAPREYAIVLPALRTSDGRGLLPRGSLFTNVFTHQLLILFRGIARIGIASMGTTQEAMD